MPLYGGIDLQEAGDDFPHDADPDGPKAQAVFHDLGLLEDVVPKRGELVKMLAQVFEFLQISS